MKISKELKAGLIVIATFACFWWMFQYLKGNDVFTSGDIYYIEFENVDGLAPTKPVTLNGLQVGRVISIEPISDNKGNYTFKVKITVDDEFKINKKTIAEIFEPGIMAGKQIRLIPSPAPPLAQSGDQLEGRLNASITDVLSTEITPVKNNLNNVLLGLDSTLVSTQLVMAKMQKLQVEAVLRSTNNTLKSFENTSKSASNLINNNSKDINTILKNLNTTTQNLNKNLDKFGQVADKMNRLEIEKSLVQLEETSTQLNSFMSKLNSNEGTLGKIMTDDSLYNNLNQTSENLNTLLKDVKENPNNYINISVFGRKQKK